MLATNFNKEINIFQRLYNELFIWGEKKPNTKIWMVSLKLLF